MKPVYSQAENSGGADSGYTGGGEGAGSPQSPSSGLPPPNGLLNPLTHPHLYPPHHSNHQQPQQGVGLQPGGVDGGGRQSVSSSGSGRITPNEPTNQHAPNQQGPNIRSVGSNSTVGDPMSPAGESAASVALSQLLPATSNGMGGGMGGGGFLHPYHQMMRGLPGVPQMGSRRYPCKLCSAMFESKAELQIHTQVHMREAKPYKCNQCPKSFANSSYLSQHMRIHLGIKPFGPCQYCGRKFTQLSHLQQHLRTHTGEKPYRCKYPNCEKAFSQLSNLQSHSRCHQTDKPYKCNSCYKCYSNEQDLLDHIPKHKESKHLKVHLCPYCGKSYTQGTYLAKHMTKHNDRRDKDQRMREIMMGREAEMGWANPYPADPDPHSHPNTPRHYAFGASNMMGSGACGYGTSGLAGAGGMGMGMGGGTDHSAFTPLGLFQSGFNPSARNPYLSYDSIKAAQPTSLSSSGYNSLLKLTRIEGYGKAHATASTSGAAPSSADIQSLMHRDYQMR